MIARPLACLDERMFPVGLRVACNGHKCRIPSREGKSAIVLSVMEATLYKCFDNLTLWLLSGGEKSAQSVMMVALPFKAIQT